MMGSKLLIPTYTKLQYIISLSLNLLAWIHDILAGKDEEKHTYLDVLCCEEFHLMKLHLSPPHT